MKNQIPVINQYYCWDEDVYEHLVMTTEERILDYLDTELQIWIIPNEYGDTWLLLDDKDYFDYDLILKRLTYHSNYYQDYRQEA